MSWFLLIEVTRSLLVGEDDEPDQEDDNQQSAVAYSGLETRKKRDAFNDVVLHLAAMHSGLRSGD